MFINFTNHDSELWSKEQHDAAEKYGDIADLPFPVVDPDSPSDNINRLADEYAELICGYKPDAVLVQGEMTLTYAVVSRLLEKGVNVICATTERSTSTHFGQDGKAIKVSEFRFVQFRGYG